MMMDSVITHTYLKTAGFSQCSLPPNTCTHVYVIYIHSHSYTYLNYTSNSMATVKAKSVFVAQSFPRYQAFPPVITPTLTVTQHFEIQKAEIKF